MPPAALPRTNRKAAWRLAAALLAVLAASGAAADTWSDLHDGPTTAWKSVPDGGGQLLSQQRVRLGEDGGAEAGAERIAYVAPPGFAAWFFRDVPPAAVIDELAVEIDLRTASPGAMAGVEVVLPRSKSADDAPLRLRLRAAPKNAASPGDVTVRLDNLPQRLQREVRVWRAANPGTSIDPRGAYVVAVAVGLPGAGRPAQAWIKQVRLESLVAPLQAADDEGVASQPPPTADESPATGHVRPTEVTLRSDGFRIDGELFFPRLWRWRGEALPWLAQRGVNTLWLDKPPTRRQLAEAAHHRLRVVCPPPTDDEQAAALGTLDRVLAWVVPGEQDKRSLDAGLATVEAIRGLEQDHQRPILAHVAEDAASWSRLVDGLLLTATGSRVAASAEAADGLAARRVGVPPGTPLLAIVPLDVGPRFAGQLDALLGDGVASAWLPTADVATTVDVALWHGVTGVAFASYERLDEPDNASAAAAAWLEMVNRRLRLLEPWFTGPHSSNPIASSFPAVLRNRGGVRLATTPLMPKTPADDEALLLLPGVDETARVYRLTPVGVSPWSTRRAAGGVAAALPCGASPGDLLVCNDQRVVQSLQAYTAQTGPLAAANAADVAAKRLRLTEALAPAQREKAERRLGDARLAASRRDHAAAYDAAYEALSIVSDAEMHRRAIAHQDGWAASSPLAVLPGTLTDHFRMSQLLASSPRGPNLLYGGSFEEVEELRRLGWRRPTGETPGSVELVEADPVHAKHVLRLIGDATGAAARIVSPAVELSPGDTVEVTGWARVEGDGALVLGDSLGGDELALPIAATNGQWRPFHLLRAAAAETSIRLTFETRGAVTADVDGVMIRAVQPLGVARRVGSIQK